MTVTITNAADKQDLVKSMESSPATESQPADENSQSQNATDVAAGSDSVPVVAKEAPATAAPTEVVEKATQDKADPQNPVVEATQPDIVGTQNDQQEKKDNNDSATSSVEDKIKWANVADMAVIVNSPYEVGANAEIGLEAFEKFKSLLDTVESLGATGRRSSRSFRPSAGAIELLGRELAEAMVTANHQISLSGIIYSADWLDGVIRDVNCGEIPVPMLLLCFQEQRFSRADFDVLSRMIEDMDISNMVREALTAWGIGKQYPALSQCKSNPFAYIRTRRTKGQRSEIFVARAYACLNALKLKSMPEDVSKKVHACLQIMEEGLVKNPPPSIVDVPPSLPATSVTAQPPSTMDISDDERSVRHEFDEFEQLDMDTGLVVSRCQGIGEVLEKINGAGGVINTVLVEQASNSPAYLWRRLGSKSTPAYSNEGVVGSIVPRSATRVEKVCLTTGYTLEEFKSVRHAISAIGGSGKGLYECLHGRKDEYMGFFWRVKGSNRIPRGLREETGIEVVTNGTSAGDISPPGGGIQRTFGVDGRASKRIRLEDGVVDTPLANQTIVKRCLVTGSVLETFASPRECWESVGEEGMKGVSDALSGKRKSYDGYEWQYGESSYNAPGGLNFTSGTNEPLNNSGERGVEKISMSNGHILHRYPSARAAQAALHRCEGKGVENVCNGNQPSYKGWFWRWEGSSNLPRGLKREPRLQRRSLESTSELPAPVVRSELSGIWKKTDPIQRFDGWPYSEASGFEQTEELFIRLGMLLTPSDEGGRRVRPSPEARETFGDLALPFVLTTRQILLSSVTYGSDWQDGTIRDVKCGSLPDSKLLLCLSAPRIANAKREVLTAIVNDLSVQKIVGEACRTWGLESLYPRVVDAGTKTVSSQLPLEAYHCLIFVARAVLCMKVLSVSEPGAELASKIRTCLDQLETAQSRRFGTQTDMLKTPIVVQHGDVEKRQLERAAEIVILREAQEVSTNQNSIPVAVPHYRAIEGKRSARESTALDPDVRRTIWTNFATDVPQPKALEAITNSPYEGSRSAEVGEQMFESFFSLFAHSAQGNSPNTKDVIRIFGAALGSTLLNAHAGIVVSGMVYHPDWRNGKVAGEQLGFIPKHLLLLLLQGNRFSRNGVENVLVRIINDLGLRGIIKDAIAEWSLGEKYPEVARINASTVLKAQKSQCYKCILFVTRAYRCMKALGLKSVCPGILSKVESCLEILDRNLEPHHSPPKDDVAAAQGVGESHSGSSTEKKQRSEEDFVISRKKSSKKRKREEKRRHSSLRKSSSVNSLWFPHDPDESILNHTEVEIAWLAEESIYCLRNRDIQWHFVWKYSSPSLKEELRKIHEPGEQLKRLVRLQDPLVSRRFATVRREIRKKLHRGFLRAKMNTVISQLRQTNQAPVAAAGSHS
eukprot:Nitzschia sp. Nitz4//scaffold7_size249615//109300//113496//NITZ4_001172-RA/size249615-processed-gene-0.349-mRNA-1//-1//CDS//3329558427//271//frame0